MADSKSKSMKSWWKRSRAEIYIAAVLVPSIILSVLALWALIQQYRFVSCNLDSKTMFFLAKNNSFGYFSKVSIFSFFMVIVSLLLILIIGSYLSTRDTQRQLELAQLKSEFVSTISHEFKTPLTSIRLLAERLLKLKPEEKEKRREYHNLILTQSYRLSYLISNVLDFSRLEEEGEARYRFEQVDLGELVRQLLDDYPMRLVRPDCVLRVNISSDLPLFNLDNEAVSRAFINILDNALKFSRLEGVVKITVDKVNSEEGFIEVEDQGPGIDDKEKKVIFERFYHTGKGTGLGLAIVHYIVKSHNGRVELESEKGKGSKFRITLPFQGNG